MFKTKAVVLKTADLKEADKLVWFFSEKLGKVSAVAKGAKRSKSKYLSMTLPFCFGEYVIFKGKSMFTVSEGEIIDSFQDFLTDLDSIAYASYLCELIDISMSENESNKSIFKEFVSAFYLLKSKAVEYDIIARSFEIKLLNATGYGLDLENCCMCKKKMNSSNYISFQYFGGVCNECTKENGAGINYASYNALKFLSKVPIDKIHRVTLSSTIKEDLYKILTIFILNSYGRKPNSLETFNYYLKE